MPVQNNVNFQGNVPKKEKQYNTRWALLSGPIIAASNILIDAAFDKELRKDTFINTAKECAKDFTGNWKNVFAGIAKYGLRQEELGNKIFNLANNNKKIFAAAFLIETLFYTGCVKLGMDWASKYKHRKD